MVWRAGRIVGLASMMESFAKGSGKLPDADHAARVVPVFLFCLKKIAPDLRRDRCEGFFVGNRVNDKNQVTTRFTAKVGTYFL